MTALPSSPAGRWLLLGSLALNVALLVALALPQFGVIVGGDGRERGERMRIPGPWALRSALGEERRAQIEPLLRQHRAPIRSAVRETRAARRAVNEALQAEPFDRARLERELATLRALDGVTAAAVHAMLVDAVAELEVGEREAVAERMWRRHRGERRERRNEAGRDEAADRGDRRPSRQNGERRRPRDDDAG